MELELNLNSTPFDLENTLQCGQLFRWKKHRGWWYGIVERRVFKVRHTYNTLEFKGVNVDFVKNYFRLDDNLPRIVSEISRDSLIRRAVQEFSGLRIVRQNPWECLISYICATYKNIPAIKNMISELSRQFGTKTSFENYDFHTFPEPDALAESTLDELRKCKLGFRAKWIREVAEMVDSHEVDFEAIKQADYETAKAELLHLPGVGNKVVDCILLFSLEKLDAFPIDVWIKRVIHSYYADYFNASFIDKISAKKSLSSREYERIGSFARDYFGKYAGYAQEYLFHFARTKQML